MLNIVTQYISILNKYHLVPSRLISVYHHPPFKKILTYGKADVSMFFTKKLYDVACQTVSDNRMMIFNLWYPDTHMVSQ